MTTDSVTRLINSELARMLLADKTVYAGQARYVICGQEEVKGIKRSLFGGVLLDHQGSDRWEAFDGSVIFIPRRELVVPHKGAKLDYLVMSLGEFEAKPARKRR